MKKRKGEPRIITDSHREKLRVNMAKAREARSEKSAGRKSLINADQDKLREAASVMRGLLNKVSTTYGSGELDKRFCLGCEKDYVDLIPNSCPCQAAHKFVQSVEEALGDG